MPRPWYEPKKSPPAPGLLDGWLLLMLRDGESYGRALVGCLLDRGVSIESHHAYRRLRALDVEGAVASRWTASDAGPRRRSYRLTAKGRRRLSELAANLTASSQLHERFLSAYQRSHDTPEATGSEHDLADESREPSQPPDGDAQIVNGRNGGPAQPAEAALPPAVGRQLLAAWLLLLLRPGPSYGYGLRRALFAHQVRADPGATYRVLRQLERDGWLQSRWLQPAAGPRRRLYRLTPTGWRHLEELVTAIAGNQNSHAAFLRAYER